MDQVKQFEQQIFAAVGSSDQISEQIKEQAQDYLIQVYQNVEMIGFCISNFQNFENLTSKIFTLNLILFFLKEKFQELSAEQIQAIQQFLFAPIFISEFGQLSEQLAIQLLSSQTHLIINIFPNPWATFFNEFIFLDPNNPNYNDIFVKNFLTFFCNELNNYTPTKFSQISNLRAHLQQTEISTRIIQYSIEKCQQNEAIGYQILSNAVTLCPIQIFLENEPFRMTLQGGLSNINFIIYVFEAFNKMISRTMEPNIKAQLMALYLNPNSIIEIVKAIDNHDIYAAAARLINKALIIWQFLDIPVQNPPEDLGSQYFMLNLNFIQLNESASSQVLYSVYSYMIKHQDIIPEIDKQLVNRIIANFSEPTVIDYYELTIKSSQRYSSIIINNLLQSDQLVLQLIESYVPSFNFVQNPGVCSAIIFLISQAFNKFQSKTLLNAQFPGYLNLFVSILNVPPPFSPQQIFCLFIFLAFAAEQPSLINVDILTSITAVMLGITMIDGLNEFFRNKILKTFPPFEFKLSKQRIINVEEQFLDAYIQTNNFNFVKTASKLVQCLNKDKKLILNQKYIELFAQALLGNDENNESKLPIYLSALSYIANAYIDFSQVDISKQILERALVQPMILQNDLALSILIQAVPQVQTNLVIPVYNQIINYCKGCLSLKSICSQLKGIVSTRNIEWAPQMIDYLYQITISHINEFLIKDNFGVKLVKFEKSIQEFIIFIGCFLSSVTKLDWNDYTGQIIKSMIPMINNLANYFYNSIKIFGCCIDFMSILIKMQRPAEKWNNPEFINLLNQSLLSFLPISFNIIFNPLIDFLSKPWKNLMKKLYSFHNNFSTKFENGVDMLAQQFQRLGAPPNFVQNYMKISEISYNRDESLAIFYHDLSIYFNGLNV